MWSSMLWLPTAQWHTGLTLLLMKSRLHQLSHVLYLSSPVSKRSPSEPSSPSPGLRSGKLRILPGMFHKLNSRGWDRKQWDNKSTAQKEFLILSLTQQLWWAGASLPSSILSLTFNDYLTQGRAVISLEINQCFLFFYLFCFYFLHEIS